MKQKLCDVSTTALDKLPAQTADKSGIGVHYIDAYIKPMNATLPDGTSVKCKRRGLKITLTAGAKKGEGLMRRLQVSADPIVMLDAALQEAAAAAGIALSMEEGALFLDT
jgi:hypothetical protein